MKKLAPTIALGLVALLGQACSSGPAEGATSTSGTAARPTAVRFAECMRDNGVDAFPDPDASGELTIDGVVNGSSIDADSPTFERALDACKDLEPSGFTGHRRNAEQQAAALEFAKCIRTHGVADFPDPAPDAPMVDTNKIPSSDRKGGMATLNAAMKACSDPAGRAMTGKR